MKHIKKVISISLVVLLTFGVFAGSVTANKTDEVPTADSLKAYLQIGPVSTGERKLIYEYAPSDLEKISNGHNIRYATIDNLPTTVYTEANGVYIVDLIDDLDGRTGYSLWDSVIFQLLAPDGWHREYELNWLYTSRYYFPKLLEPGAIDSGEDNDDFNQAATGKVNQAKLQEILSSGIPVEPMLAVTRYQQRIFPLQPLDPGYTLNSSERFVFCYGMSENELINSTRITSEFGRGVNEIVLYLPAGSVEVVKQPDDAGQNPDGTGQTPNGVGGTPNGVERTPDSVGQGSENEDSDAKIEDGHVPLQGAVTDVIPVSAETAKAAESSVMATAKAFFDSGGILVKSAGVPVSVTTAEKNTVAVLNLPDDIDTTKITTMAVLGDDGALTPIPTRVDENGIVTVLISGEVTLVPLSVEASFTDIAKISKAVTQEITRAASLMIIQGRGNGIFDPSAKVTKQEAVTMFLRAIGVPVDYKTAMKTANEQELKIDEAAPREPMSRIETAELIVSALNSVGIEQKITPEEAEELLADFTDLDGLTDSETLSMALCVKLGIFLGAGNGLMNPHDTLLRSQMASLAVRLQDVILGAV